MNIHSGFSLYIVSWQRKYFPMTQIIIFDNFNIFLGKTFYPVFNYTSLWCLLKGRTNFLYWLMKLISKTQSVIPEYPFPISRRLKWNKDEIFFRTRSLHLCLTIRDVKKSHLQYCNMQCLLIFEWHFAVRRWSALDLEPLKFFVQILEQ